MARLYSLAEVLSATGARGEGLTGDNICSISIDSRELGPESLFVAIKGDVHDGHDFVGKALDNGAVAALVSQSKAVDLGERLLIVPDALDGLYNLARFSRARSIAKIVGVTGSAGKTTTKEAIRTILSSAGQTHASIRSFNNHWGVPLTLARMPAGTQFGVFEIGMNHAGEITPLTELVRPHVVVITTVAPAHLEFFPSVAAIAEAKAEIFLGLEPGGVAVLNADHDHLDVLLDAARRAGVGKVVTYGFSDRSNVRIGQRELGSDGFTTIPVALEGTVAMLRVALSGRHMFANAVAALIAAREVGVPVEASLAALARFEAPEGRGQSLRLGDPANPLLLIDESYNANPASMRAALDVFATTAAPKGRKVLVLGDMRELGATSRELHAALAPEVLSSGADSVFLIGPDIAALRDALPAGSVAGWAQSTADLTEAVLSQLAPGDAVMVKGSNGTRLGPLVKAIRDRFG